MGVPLWLRKPAYYQHLQNEHHPHETTESSACLNSMNLCLHFLSPCLRRKSSETTPPPWPWRILLGIQDPPSTVWIQILLLFRLQNCLSSRLRLSTRARIKSVLQLPGESLEHSIKSMLQLPGESEKVPRVASRACCNFLETASWSELGWNRSFATV